jgi:hypothetical protein
MKGNYYLKVMGCVAITIFIGCSAQAQFKTSQWMASTTWSYTFGGTNNEYGEFLLPTSDGGYIVAGSTRSYGSGEDDFWVIKVDANVHVLWQKTFGGYNFEYLYWIEETNDGGYVFTGSISSYSSGGYDAWVIKMNKNGIVEWQKAYGTIINDYPWQVHQLKNGGYIVSAKYGYVDCTNCQIMVLRLDSSGNLLWNKIMGNAPWNEVTAIRQTDDEGFIVTGNVTNFGKGRYDFWIAKLNASGTIEWQKAYGGPQDDLVNSIIQTNDGGYLLAGKTKSFGAGGFDAAIIKIDKIGNIVWQKTYGGSLDDRAFSINKLESRNHDSGSYLVVGASFSFGSSDDGWIFKINSWGNVEWSKSYGGSYSDRLYYAFGTLDGGIAAGGDTESFGASHETYDTWVMKLNASGTFDQTCGITIKDANFIPANAYFTATDTIFVSTSVPMITLVPPFSALNSNGAANPICSGL